MQERSLVNNQVGRWHWIAKYLATLSLGLYVVQPWSISYLGIPLQVVFIWLAFAVVTFSNSRIGRPFTVFATYEWVLIIIFGTFVTCRSLIDGDQLLRIYQLLTGIVLATVVFRISDDERTRRLLLLSIALLAVASTLVAILQLIGFAPWSWRGTMYYLSGNKTPCGLETYPVSYAFSVIGIGVTLLATEFVAKRNYLRSNVSVLPPLTLWLGFFILLGLAISGSRSGILGMIMGVFVSILLAHLYGIQVLGKAFVYFIATMVLVAGIASQTDILERIGSKAERISEDTRLLSNWAIFYPVIVEYPLGVPGAIIKEAKARGVVGFGSRNIVEKAYEANYGYDPHNMLLTTAVYYGWVSAICLVFFFISLFLRGINFLRKDRNTNNKLYGIYALLALGALTAIIVHSWFHNANLALGEMRGWFWVGLLLWAIKPRGAREPLGASDSPPTPPILDGRL
ncbi:O-antigen ligase family protein [Thiocystis violacea]|uniref:O-antigen ligase family protein n=1 Tax=Thiocystis violacea TaxID=13725 RepID=UPI001906FFEF|nr:O-antigen ligase family protein [Thiocystis violacea]